MARSAELTRAERMFAESVPSAAADLHERRRGYEALMSQFPLPADAEVSERDIAGVHCIEVRAPRADATRVIIYGHGGGYMMGSAAGYREFAYRLSAATAARVVLVDYRLAPEHPFPAAVEDLTAVYRALRTDQTIQQIAISGDSAGGGLALGSTMSIRDSGDPLPDAVIAISPMTDLTASGDSMQTNREADVVVKREGVLRSGAERYLEGREPSAHPYASPHHGDKRGLPPVLLLVGSSEVLLDDSVRFHEEVLALGGQSKLEIAPDMLHVWPIFPFLAESQQALDTIGAFLA